MNLVCQICGEEKKNFSSLSAHVRLNHNITSREYYDKFLKKENEEKCLFCGKETKYTGTRLGYKDFCADCSKKSLKDRYIIKYGKEEGIEKYNKSCQKHSDSMKGKNKGKDNGMYKYPKLKVKCSQCGKEIEKHGKSKAKNFFCDINCKSNWQKEHSECLYFCNPEAIQKGIDTKLKRYGSHKKAINREKAIQTMIKNNTYKNNTKYSKQSQGFIHELLKYLPKEYKYYFGEGETFLREKDIIYFYDFEIREKKIFIEYQGDQFHGNPKIYESSDHPSPFNKNITAKEIWEKDLIKKQFAEKRGYKVFYVWENDWINNPSKTINSILKKLNLKEELYGNK